MNERLRELMELSRAVDTLCAACDKENDKRKTVIMESYEEKWNKMWDDIENDVLPVVEEYIKNEMFLRNHFPGLCYDYHYIRPTGDYYALDSHQIKFYYPSSVFIDYTDGKHCRIKREIESRFHNNSEITAHGFELYNMGDNSQRRVEGLLDDWDRLYEVIMKDLADRMEKQIKERLKAKEKEVKELMREAGEKID